MYRYPIEPLLNKGYDDELLQKQYQESEEAYSKFFREYERKLWDYGSVRPMTIMDIPTYMKLDFIEKDVSRIIDERPTLGVANMLALGNSIPRFGVTPEDFTEEQIDTLFCVEPKTWSFVLGKFTFTIQKDGN